MKGTRGTKILLVVALCMAAAMPAWGAAMWQPVLPLTQQGRTSLELFVEGEGYVLHANGGSANFYKSLDSGATWLPAELPPISGTPMMDFATAENGYVFANDQLFATRDGAGNWKKLGSPEPRKRILGGEALSVSRRGRHLALVASLWHDSAGVPWTGGCHDPREDKLFLYTSTDSGGTWERRLISDPLAPVFDIDFIDADNGVVTIGPPYEWEQSGSCSFSGSSQVGKRILVTGNGGRTWRPVLRCKEFSCLAVAMVSRDHFVVGSSDGSVFTTRDGGRNFHVGRLDGFAELPTRDSLRWAQGIEFANGRVGYLSTNGRGVWRTDDGGLTWTRETSTQDAPGFAFGSVAVADAERAIAGGPTFVIRRLSN